MALNHGHNELPTKIIVLKFLRHCTDKCLEAVLQVVIVITPTTIHLEVVGNQDIGRKSQLARKVGQ